LWLAEGLGGCDVVKKGTRAYKSEMGVISSWIKECCITDVKSEEQSSVLYEPFRLWPHKKGEYVVNTRKFKQKLLQKDIQLSQKSKGSIYSGFRLQDGLLGP
jgi:putative DNA primase/helicase|tara:strand:+ start:53 stop:358 length:306 start_codon:yes stop_codon:yes gene_type:complete